MYFLIQMISIIFLIGMMVFGYRKGLLMKLVSLVSFIVIIMIAKILAPYLAFIPLFPKAWLPLSSTEVGSFLFKQVNIMIWFIFIIIILKLSMLIIKPFMKMISKIPIISIVNKILGMLLGLLEAILILFIVVIICKTPLVENGEEYVTTGVLSPINGIIEGNADVKENDVVWTALQKIAKKEVLTSQEKIELHKWMLAQGMKEEDVKKFIDSLP